MTRRETALNVFLGALLLSVIAAPFVALWIAFHFASVLLHRFYPAAAKHESAIGFVLLSLLWLAVGVWDLFRCHWRAGFLTLASAATAFLASLHEFETGSGFDFPILILMVFVFTRPNPSQEDISRNTFLLATSFLCLAALSPLGFLGSGTIPRIADDVITIAVAAWFVLKLRNGWSVGDDLFAKPSNSAPLS